MGAVGWSLGSLTEAQFLVRESAVQHILRKLSRQKSRQKLLEGPRPGSTRSLPRRGRALEARKYMSRRLCPRTSVVAKLACQKETELSVLNAGTILRAAARVD